jgi:hypothetical protein
MTNSENSLSNIRIGLSLSESPEIQALGFSDVHFKDIVIEFSRYLLACGATLAYGGDFRQAGFTEVLFDLKATYKGNASKIVSYLGWPIHAEMDELSDEEKLRYQNAAEFVKSPIPDGVDESIPRDKFLPPIKTNLDNMLIWARSMSKMRREYLAKENDAQILLGGRLTNYSSKYPGVVEEAYEIMKAGKPLFLIGAFGGATRAVIDAVSGGQPESLSETGQYELWDQFEAETHQDKAAAAKHDLEQAPLDIAAVEKAIKTAEAELEQARNPEEKVHAEAMKKAAEQTRLDAVKRLEAAKKYDPTAKLQDYRGLVKYFNQYAPAPEERIDYSALTEFFNQQGIAGLNNQLSEEENKRLFTTPHVAEMIALTLKGLARINK